MSASLAIIFHEECFVSVSLQSSFMRSDLRLLVWQSSLVRSDLCLLVYNHLPWGVLCVC